MLLSIKIFLKLVLILMSLRMVTNVVHRILLAMSSHLPVTIAIVWLAAPKGRVRNIKVGVVSSRNVFVSLIILITTSIVIIVSSYLHCHHRYHHHPPLTTLSISVLSKNMSPALRHKTSHRISNSTKFSRMQSCSDVHV